jgi:hypothetical protein
MDGAPTQRSPVWRLLLLAFALACVLTDLVLAGADMNGASDDFWPQWTLAHLTATGHGADAYDFSTQANLFRDLNVPKHRAILLEMPQIKDIGICPYPPTFAVVFAPVCRLPFDSAALIVYFVSIGLALVAAWAVGAATDGRLCGLPAAIALPSYAGVQSILLIGMDSWAALAASSIGLAVIAAVAFGRVTGRTAGMVTAAIAILCYPGVGSTLHLGQNSLLTLALLALGWRDLVRRRDLAAGLWWGLLAYKIHWLIAIGWVPLVIGRTRVLIGMAASAGVLALAATALLGPAAWVRWGWQIVTVDHVYATDQFFRESLLILGCDLRSILIRYTQSPAIGRVAGWTALVAVAVVTAVWYRRRPTADPAGPEGAGLLFASGLTAAHLYYYDETVFLLPLLVLWSYRMTLAWWQFVSLIGLTAAYYAAARYMLVWSRAFEGPPIWTFVVLALWVLSLTVKSKGSAA